MTTLFSDGFDDGDFSGWSESSGGGGSVSCLPDAAAHGPYGVSMYAPSYGAIKLTSPVFSASGLSEAWARCYLRFGTMVSEGQGSVNLPFRLKQDTGNHRSTPGTSTEARDMS